MNKAQFINPDSSAQLAQEGVEYSVKRFENALEKLMAKVEDSAQIIQHVENIANKPKDLLLNLKHKTEAAVDMIRRNPAPYFIAVAGIASAVGIFLWVRSQKDYC